MKWIRKNAPKLIAMLCILVSCVALSACESCARSCKDCDSDMNGGLYRTVKVYTYDGNLVAEYTGKFDIETDNETYILWDDETGKRHIIYYTNFNIIIDER